MASFTLFLPFIGDGARGLKTTLESPRKFQKVLAVPFSLLMVTFLDSGFQQKIQFF